MKKYLDSILNLKENTDFDKTKAIISEGVSIRGYNLCLLICSSILASIGLDTNSAAVIIGAMLISPLMSPILGVGLSLGIHDKHLLGRAFKDLLLALLISLAASMLYFFLSPLGQPTAELQARTFPTLLDVLVALFGGFAGIVSISRHEQTNAIPGVAIATALMPPLCTAGFGLATLHWNYFLGAFYLFFINAVFISLATYLIVRYLHFPEKEFISRKSATQYRVWFVLIIIVALIPSIYFLYTVYRDEVIKRDIDTLVISPIKKQGNEILKWEVVKKDSSKLIKVYYSGKQITDSLENSIDSILRLNDMKSYSVVSTQLNLTKEEVSELSAEMTKQMFEELHLDELKQKTKVDTQPADTLVGRQVFTEVKIAFPYIDSISNAWMIHKDTLNKVDSVPIVFYSSKKRITKKQLQQFYSYMKTRLSNDTVLLINKQLLKIP